MDNNTLKKEWFGEVKASLSACTMKWAAVENSG